MTADAKVGLLLGLFFIVIIAFLVNGLPAYIQDNDTTTTKVSIVKTPGQDMVLDNKVQETAHRLFPNRKVENQRIVEPPVETVILNSPEDQAPQVEVAERVPPPQAPVIVENTPSTVVQENPVAPKVQTHIVESGQTLPVIAKHYYGSEEGNRRIVIQKLYEANSTVLKSPDLVCVGDKLVIPSRDALLSPQSNATKAPNASKTLLNKFSDLLEQVGQDDMKSVREYTVQNGDSLWSIAEQSLGDGNRYKEIAQLNKGRIRNANNVSVGTRLVIPPQ